MKIRPKNLVIAGTMAAMLIAVTVFASSGLRQPVAADYDRLDSQRQAVDMSMNAYGPLYDIFLTDYNNVFREERSKDEVASVKKAYVDSLGQEREINQARLDTMRSSIALRQPEIKESFQAYDVGYSAVVKYYDRYTNDTANITESIAGPCAKLSQMNVAVSSFAADYTKAADACLAALETAEKRSSSTTKTLLTDVETVVTKRRNAFKDTIDKEGFKQKVSNITALLTLLDINAEVREIQARYKTTVETEYTKLVNDANKSNQAFDKALDQYLASDAKQGSKS